MGSLAALYNDIETKHIAHINHQFKCKREGAGGGRRKIPHIARGTATET